MKRIIQNYWKHSSPDISYTGTQTYWSSLTNFWLGWHLRIRNVEAATKVGITGLHFKNAELLLEDLHRSGVDI
ncbi:hypothetical protein SLEP1_g14802 [Rubroshorea leprosula]|uniref:Uncharacterized protein n=1 Tax=Rubroshorea leprosula TaxID=152421 RepID=A0AAV5IRC3_9ROSI|nr:hypothetical protein SLEP1_g14802 [Rubroshorea leprosula]